MYATQLLVTFFRELALHPNHRLEAGVKVRNAQVEQLWQFCDELLVQHIEHFLCVVVFLLGLSSRDASDIQHIFHRHEAYSWKLGGIVAGLVNELIHLAPSRIVVE